MKTKLPHAVLSLSFLSALSYPPSILFAQGTAFTYQGRLNDSGNPANGLYDIRAGLFVTNSGGAVVAGPVTNSAVAVSNGLFSITLDYGNVFNGTSYWLEVAVRSNNVAGFTTLSPRQQLTPAPYAIFAEGANAAGLSGTVPSSSLAGGYSGAVNFTNPVNSFAGNGAGLSNVNAAMLSGLTASNFWQTTGNAGTTPGLNFLGTTDNKAFDLYANNVRALRLVLRTDASGYYSNAPNVIGGSSVNQVSTGAVGGTVGGGGGNLLSDGSSLQNIVTADFGTIGGGYLNIASNIFATVGGGENNAAGGQFATVGGGQNNIAGGQWATVGGGSDNNASGSEFNTVGGGFHNIATGGDATVGGGIDNYASGAFATVAGGFLNSASGNTATVGGGDQNTAGGDYATVAGGEENTANAIGSFIGGGGFDGTTFAGNLVNSKAATIVGGLANDITGGAEYAFIGGGSFNTNSGYGSFIGGGGYDGTSSAGNQVKANASAIVGGLGNQILGGAPYAFIGGGNFNTNSGQSATVCGGNLNTASGQSATVSGGNLNTASGDYSMIPGGQANAAQGKYSFAGGFGAVAAHNGCFLWADNHNFGVMTAVPNLFAARCTGGVTFVTGIDGSGNGTSGVYVTSGGNSWSSVSDRNAKKNFQPVNTVAVLNKLATIPIEQWNYKWEDNSDTPNLGPMAQDFKAAFFPGRDDKSISTLEFDGVELAAIQGLNHKLEDELNNKEKEIQELRQAVNQLKERVNQMASKKER